MNIEKLEDKNGLFFMHKYVPIFKTAPTIKVG